MTVVGKGEFSADRGTREEATGLGCLRGIRVLGRSALVGDPTPGERLQVLEGSGRAWLSRDQIALDGRLELGRGEGSRQERVDSVLESLGSSAVVRAECDYRDSSKVRLGT